MAKSGRRRRSKADWLEAGLLALESQGVDSVRVERLARSLGVAKSGFYWHFQDRAQLLDEMLEFWAHEYTAVVTTDVDLLALAPEKRLVAAATMVWKHNLSRFDLPFRAWAQADPAVMARVSEVYEMRLAWIRRTLEDVGFRGDDLEMRTRLFVCYHTWERAMFPRQSDAQAKKLIKQRMALLLRR